MLQRGKFGLWFDRLGHYSLQVPDDMGPDDWTLPARVMKAVREVLRPEPVTEALHVVDDTTQPIAPLFRPGLNL